MECETHANKLWESRKRKIKWTNKSQEMVEWSTNISTIILCINDYMLIKGDLQSWLKISLVIYFLSEIYFKYTYIGKWKVKIYYTHIYKY